MSKKKEFWLRHNDVQCRFRIWNKNEQTFDNDEWCWLLENADHTFEIGFTVWSQTHNRFIIQQATGCMDKNGKLIFEGDILETDEAGWIGVVVFGDGRFSIKDSKSGFNAEPNWSGCKIIGNVYENPELIP